MQTIFRAGAALSLPTGRLGRLIAVLQTFLSPFLLLFPWLLAGGASAWAADLSLQGAPAPVVAAATVPDTAQADIPGHVDVLALGSPPDLVGLPDASLAANTAIDANRATAEQLQTLRGIGPAMAARIIAERERQPFASLDDLTRRVRGVGKRRLRQWQEAGLVLSSRPSAVVQDRAVHGHRGHAPSVGARGADTQGTEVRGAGVQSPHAMGANALGANVQGAHAPGTQAPVGGKSARAGRVSTHPPRHAGAAGRTIEVIRGNPRLSSRASTARPGRATKGRSAAGRSSAEMATAGRAAERSLAGPHSGDAAQALSRSVSTTGSRTASRARGHRADEPSCRLQRRVHQRGRSGKGAQVRRSTAPSLFEDRPLFDCRSIFDERSRLLPRS